MQDIDEITVFLALACGQNAVALYHREAEKYGPLPLLNRVTERAPTQSLWMVSVTWRGGFNRRPFLLENVFRTEGEARTEAERLALNPERLNDYGPVAVRRFEIAETVTCNV